jgi:hypothetical protein
VGHVDLAADLQDGGGVPEPRGDVPKRAGVGGDVLAGLAVAAGRGLDQAAVLVAQRQRQAVDLGLGDIGQRRLRRQREEAPDAVVELGDGRGVEGVLEAEHGAGVADLGEGLRRCRAHLVAGAVGAAQLGEAGLQGGVAALEGVVLGVADRGGVGLVIGEVRHLDLAGEMGEFGRRLLGREILDGAALVHGWASPELASD